MKTKLIFLIFIVFPLLFTAQAKRKKNSNFGFSIPVVYSLGDAKTSEQYNIKSHDGFIFQATTAIGAGVTLGFISPVLSNKTTNENFIVNTNFIEFYYDIPLSEFFLLMVGYGIGEYSVSCQNALCKQNYGEKEIKTELNSLSLLNIKVGFFVGHLYYITLSNRIVSATNMTVTSTINDKSFEVNMTSSIIDFGITAYY